jgi:GH15 family glucan-1,4-alpha-glucosidase
MSYEKSIELLRKVASPNGFLASAEATTNYQRVWARDGVICGLAALASGDAELIQTFKHTLETLSAHQHELGTIPSNVACHETGNEVSYGGLAGRVDAHTWFVIGVCQYAFTQNDRAFFEMHQAQVIKALALLEAWEFNNKHLVYVPLSGNWADEYLTDGYVLYDQLLRVWALRSYHHFTKCKKVADKIEAIVAQISSNYFPKTTGEKFHPKAYAEFKFEAFAPCSFSPSGYKTPFDAFANSLLVLLQIGTANFDQHVIEYSLQLAQSTQMGLLPAFWPPVFESDDYWSLLKNNCKYEFRNYPYEFHNAGSWPMVNGFFGCALVAKNKNKEAQALLEQIHQANAVEDFSFYENFNTQTAAPNGVANCAWSAAAAVLLHQSLTTNFKLIH